MKKSLIVMSFCLVAFVLAITPALALVIWEDHLIDQFPEPAHIFGIHGERVDEGMIVSRHTSFQENIRGTETGAWYQHQGPEGTRLWVRWGSPLVIQEGEYYIGVRVLTYRGDGEEKEMEYLRTYRLRVDGEEIPLVSSTNPQYMPEGHENWGRVILLTGEKVHLTRRTLIEASTDKRWLGITHLLLWSEDIEQGPINLL